MLVKEVLGKRELKKAFIKRRPRFPLVGLRTRTSKTGESLDSKCTIPSSVCSLAGKRSHVEFSRSAL